MQLTLLLAVVLVLLSVFFATEPRACQEPGAPPLPPELKRLGSWVGTWDAEVTMMGQTSKGSEVCRLECGGNWLITEHTGTFMGMPFQGKGFTGFDAAKQSFTGVWIDSSGGPMSHYVDGSFSADGKRFIAHVDGADMEGKPARYEYVSSFPDARTRTFEVFTLAGEERELQMSIRYARRD
jgi:hypothetical protein